ncbi:DUF3991 domain-containing protein [Lachnospiraceae bacterium ZAX-1]
MDSRMEVIGIDYGWSNMKTASSVFTAGVAMGLIYEANDCHNIVFKGNDKDRNIKFAGMRGIFERDGKSFKCDVAGSDKHYGFNVPKSGSDELIVFEAAIDLMSYTDIYNDFETNRHLECFLMHRLPCF